MSNFTLTIDPNKGLQPQLHTLAKRTFHTIGALIRDISDNRDYTIKLRVDVQISVDPRQALIGEQVTTLPVHTPPGLKTVTIECPNETVTFQRTGQGWKRTA